MSCVLFAIAICAAAQSPTPVDTIWIPGGTFTMGASSDDARPDEFPPHQVQVDGFFMTRTEITNRQFQHFVHATGYVTTAQLPVDWEVLKEQVPPGTAKPSPEMLQPGSMVFQHAPLHSSPNDLSARWAWVPGASWKHPEGPESSLEGRLDHPVVHVSHHDAIAYAQWRGGSLPTEAQWEYAARGGAHRKPFVWGDDVIKPAYANVWQGTFPNHNTNEDGFAGTARVGAFPANAFGLHDMAGNVWEWTADRYQHNLYSSRSSNDLTVNPTGPDRARDPRNPYAKDVRVHRGGSFLCHASYCSSYRPAARMATTPDSALSHLGFRVIFTKAQAQALPSGIARPRDPTSTSQ